MEKRVIRSQHQTRTETQCRMYTHIEKYINKNTTHQNTTNEYNKKKTISEENE